MDSLSNVMGGVIYIPFKNQFIESCPFSSLPQLVLRNGRWNQHSTGPLHLDWEVTIENVACVSFLGKWGCTQKQKHNHHILSYFCRVVFETSPRDCLTCNFGDPFPIRSIVHGILLFQLYNVAYAFPHWDALLWRSYAPHFIEDKSFLFTFCRVTTRKFFAFRAQSINSTQCQTH